MCDQPDTSSLKKNVGGSLILLMEEILHHLGCIKPIDNGISNIPTGAGFLPSTVPLEKKTSLRKLMTYNYYQPHENQWWKFHELHHFWLGIVLWENWEIRITHQEWSSRRSFLWWSSCEQHQQKKWWEKGSQHDSWRIVVLHTTEFYTNLSDQQQSGSDFGTLFQSRLNWRHN